MGNYILAIDQGTTSSRAIIFDTDQSIVASAQQEFTQYFPKSGWVEHDLEEIWDSVVTTCRKAIADASINAADIAAIGITNQRETVAVWERESGAPIGKAIVWQDRRTSDYCGTLKKAGHEPLFTEKSGLLLDPYFSGTKLAWMLQQDPSLRARGAAGEIVFGTIDTFLIWRLTGGASFVTDATNASRTLLYNIRENQWDEELLGILDVPAAMLPKVL
ncbi:MAG: FGGY family carbohydrate kinase, partial [Pseudomonadota bacterium]